MNDRRSILLATLLVAGILFVFVSPALNLPQTALRAHQDSVRALMGMLVLTCAMLLVMAMRHAAASPLVPLPVADSRVDLTCTRRC